MEFSVLGPLRVVGTAGVQVRFASASQRRLMSLFVLHANRTVSAEWLAERLDLSPGALRTSVSRLRRLVGWDVLVTSPPGYELRSDGVDALQFERWLEAAAAARLAGARPAERSALESAVEMWRGTPYPDLEDDLSAVPEIQRLTERHAAAVEDLADVLLAEHDWCHAVALLGPLIDGDPFRDRPRRQLMLALAGSGRRVEALRAFHDYRTFLLDEVGTEPSAATVALDREIGSDGFARLVGAEQFSHAAFEPPPASGTEPTSDVRHLAHVLLGQLAGTGGHVEVWSADSRLLMSIDDSTSVR